MEERSMDGNDTNYSILMYELQLFSKNSAASKANQPTTNKKHSAEPEM